MSDDDDDAEPMISASEKNGMMTDDDGWSILGERQYRRSKRGNFVAYSWRTMQDETGGK